MESRTIVFLAGIFFVVRVRKKEGGMTKYILAHTGPRELDGHPLGGCGSGFGLVPGYTTLSVRVRANI